MGALADALVSKGYNRTDAENAEKGPRAEELAREYLGSSSSGSSGSGAASTPSLSSLYSDEALKEALEISRQSQDQVVNALEGQKPLITQAAEQTKAGYESTQTTLSQKYDNLLAELTRKESVDISSTGLAAGREFGKRGIPLSSGAYDEALIERYTPIKQFYAGQTKDTELAKQSSYLEIATKINQLPGETAQKLNDLELVIANVKAGYSDKAVQILLSMGQSQNDAMQTVATLQQSASQFSQTLAQNTSQFSQNLTQRQAEQAEATRQFNAEQARLKSNTSTKTMTTTEAKAGVIAMAQSGADESQVIAKYGSYLNYSELDSLYLNSYKEAVWKSTPS